MRKFIIFPILILNILLFSVNVSAHSFIGELVHSEGDVWVTHEGQKTKVMLKSPLFVGDTVQVGARKSLATLKFEDGTFLTLMESAKVFLAKFLVGPGRRDNAFEVMAGKLRGSIPTKFNKNRSKTEFKTPTSVVGVRGTRFILDVKSQVTTAYCLEGMLYTFNPQFPTNIVDVPGGYFSTIQRGKAPTAAQKISKNSEKGKGESAFPELPAPSPSPPFPEILHPAPGTGTGPGGTR